DPSVPSRRVSRVHVQFCNVLLYIQIGHQIFDIGRHCVWASVLLFWEPRPLRGLAGIAVCRNNAFSVVCGFAGWADPATFVLRIVVSLDPDVYVGSAASSNVPEMGFEDVSVEDVRFEGKFEFVSSRADKSDRFAL